MGLNEIISNKENNLRIKNNEIISDTLKNEID
jgi:hypothetical protein